MMTKLPRLNFPEGIQQLIYHNNGSSTTKNNGISKREKDFTLKEKRRIVIEGQSGESTISEICRKEGIPSEIFYQWSHEFLSIDPQKSIVNSSMSKELTKDEKFRIVI